MKIGIYGGTFNPPHLGHLAAARAAIEVLELDRLYIVPASIPPHKELPQDTPDPGHRLAMAEKMADALLMPQVVQSCGCSWGRTCSSPSTGGTSRRKF